MKKFLDSYKTLKTTLMVQKMNRESNPYVDKNGKVYWGWSIRKDNKNKDNKDKVEE